MNHHIDFGNIHKAQSYYSMLGYKYEVVPWFVSKKAIEITVPIDIEVNDGMVASGEQSFLQMILDGELSVGKHCCITPCYRPTDKFDELHCKEFMKLELIWYCGENSKNLSNYYNSMMVSAKYFFSGTFNDLNICDIEDIPRKNCITQYSQDIQVNDIELGSYGIRYSPDIGYWVYGTGIACPRFEIAKRKIYGF